MRARNFTGETQAEAGAGHSITPRFVDTVEAIEDTVMILVGDHCASVGNPEESMRILSRQIKPDQAVIAVVLHRINGQVLDGEL